MSSKYQAYLRKIGYKLRDFIKFRVLVTTKHLLLVGGGSSLGRKVADEFKDTWKIFNVDFIENPSAHRNFILDKDMKFNAENIDQEIKKLNIKFDSIFSLNGTFIPGTIGEIDVFEKYDAMIRTNVVLSLLASKLGLAHIATNGLMVYTGSIKAFENPFPQAVGYSVSKSQNHMLAMNMAVREDFPLDISLLTILPEIVEEIDQTQASSNSMQSNLPEAANHERFSDEQQISKLLKSWADGKRRPYPGSYATLKKTKGGALYAEYL